jgi:tubulin beta
LCDEHGGIGDAQLGKINVLYHEASGGKHVSRAVFFDHEPGVIDATRASPLGELFRPGNLVNHTRGKNWAKDHYRQKFAGVSQA